MNFPTAQLPKAISYFRTLAIAAHHRFLGVGQTHPLHRRGHGLVGSVEVSQRPTLSTFAQVFDVGRARNGQPFPKREDTQRTRRNKVVCSTIYTVLLYYNTMYNTTTVGLIKYIMGLRYYFTDCTTATTSTVIV